LENSTVKTCCKVTTFNTAKQTRAGGRNKSLTASSETCSGLALNRGTQRMLCCINVYERGRGTCSSYSIAVDTRVDGCRVVILTFT